MSVPDANESDTSDADTVASRKPLKELDERTLDAVWDTLVDYVDENAYDLGKEVKIIYELYRQGDMEGLCNHMSWDEVVELCDTLDELTGVESETEDVDELMEVESEAEDADESGQGATEANPPIAENKTEAVAEKTDMPSSVRYENGTITGKKGVTYSSANEPVEFTYAVVPASVLITSHDANGIENPAFPQELQPRDRSRDASQLQISKISNSLNPELLAESSTAQNGAPIIRSDGVVIGGNARTTAIIMAYAKGRGSNYQSYIAENAARFGIDAKQLPDNPVLVRVLNSEVDGVSLAKDLNAKTTAAFSPMEQAKSDADKLGDIMRLLVVSENGDINTKSNQDFIGAFISTVVAESERGWMMTSDGRLSKAGVARVENAIFEYAYNNSELLNNLTEDLEGTNKNIINALVGVSQKAADIKAAQGDGMMYDIPIIDVTISGTKLYFQAKANGKTVAEYTDAENLLANYDAESILIAETIEANKRGYKKIQTFLNNLFDALISLGDPNQISFFDEGADYGLRDIIERGSRSYEQETGESIGRPDYERFGAYEANSGKGEAARRESPNATVEAGSRGDNSIFGNGRVVESEAWDGKKVHEATEADYTLLDKKGSHSPGTNSDTASSHGNAYAPSVDTVPNKGGEAVKKKNADNSVYGNENSGERERGFSKNIRTDENREQAIRDSFEKDPETYIQLANEDTRKKAEKLFTENSLDECRDIIQNSLGDSKNTGILTPDGVVLAKLTADEMVRRGDIDGAKNLLSDVATTLTLYGQTAQAAKILRNSGPAAKLATAQKIISKLNGELTKGQRSKNQKKKAKGVGLDHESIKDKSKVSSDLKDAVNSGAAETASYCSLLYFPLLCLETSTFLEFIFTFFR